MPRASKARTVAEIEIEPGSDTWTPVKDGFGTVKEAEEWVRNNVGFDNRIRVAKVTGVFSKTVVIAKR